MKTIILFAFIFISSFSVFSQNKPQFIIEESTDGYAIFLKMDHVSEISNVKIEGFLKQNNFTEKLLLDLDVQDIVNQKAFTRFGFEAMQAQFIVSITDSNGFTVKYPMIDFNINKQS